MPPPYNMKKLWKTVYLGNKYKKKKKKISTPPPHKKINKKKQNYFFFAKFYCGCLYCIVYCFFRGHYNYRILDISSLLYVYYVARKWILKPAYSVVRKWILVGHTCCIHFFFLTLCWWLDYISMLAPFLAHNWFGHGWRRSSSRDFRFSQLFDAATLPTAAAILAEWERIWNG